MPYQAKQLPYNLDAFKPVISKETMENHYGKHYTGYVKNFNALVKDTSFEDKPIEEILKSVVGPLYNNAAQIYNHEFFWECMSPTAKPLDEGSQLAKSIEDNFGSVKEFKQKFIDAATKLFGSGWVWLVEDDGKLLIKQMKNANEPISKNLKPLLVIDVWEHGYYLDYQSDRASYAKAYLNIVDWKFVENNLFD